MGKKGRPTKAAQFAETLTDILVKFVDEEKDIIVDTLRETANDTKDKVQAKAPADSGEYRNGFEVIEESNGSLKDHVTIVVGNPKHYQLTHLLEKGHAVKNQYGAPTRAGAKKRVRGKRHFKPAETWGTEAALSRLRERL